MSPLTWVVAPEDPVYSRVDSPRVISPKVGHDKRTIDAMREAITF